MKFHPLLILFIILGIIFFFTGIVLLYKNLIFIRKASRAKGIIVDFNTVDKIKTLLSINRAKQLHFPIVTFNTKQNKEIQFESLVSSNYEPTIDTEVEVVYLENQPEKAVIYSTSQLYIYPLVYTLIGLFFILIIFL